MKIYKINVDRATVRNKAFRRVLFTGRRMQLVLMSLLPGQEIDLEMHKNTDQFIKVEAGRGRVYEGNRRRNVSSRRTPSKKNAVSFYNIARGDAVFVPARTWHRVKNVSGKQNLSLYTLYSPPEHPDQTLQRIKP